jgi:hypothetical protein
MSITSSSRLSGTRVYVARHRGLAGSAILRRLEQELCPAITTRTLPSWTPATRGRNLVLPGGNPAAYGGVPLIQAKQRGMRVS